MKTLLTRRISIRALFCLAASLILVMSVYTYVGSLPVHDLMTGAIFLVIFCVYVALTTLLF